MVFCAAFGITVPVARMTKTEPKVGPDTDTLLGLHRAQAVATRKEWDVETAFLAAVDADSFEALLDGRALVMPFDADVWSTRGIPPLVVVGVITAGGKYGSFLDTTAAASAITYPVDFVRANTSFTVVYWRFNGATWDHYIKRSDGATWVNGVRNDAAPVFHVVDTTAGTVALSKDKHDDVMIMPALLSTNHVAAFFAFHGASALPHQRLVTVKGDFTEPTQTAFAARAFSVKRKASPSMAGASWDAAGATLSFKLVEQKT